MERTECPVYDNTPLSMNQDGRDKGLKMEALGAQPLRNMESGSTEFIQFQPREQAEEGGLDLCTSYMRGSAAPIQMEGGERRFKIKNQ